LAVTALEAVDPDGTVRALMATGCGLLEALAEVRGQAAARLDEVALEELPIDLVIGHVLSAFTGSGESLAGALDEVAEAAGDRIASEAFAALKGVVLEDDLDLRGRTWVRAFPKGIRFSGDDYGSLTLKDCVNLTSLPDSLGGTLRTLDLAGCRSLSALPEGLAIRVLLDLRGCDALRVWPTRHQFGGDVLLDGLELAAHLPEGFVVGEDLSLTGCAALCTLPKGLSVGGTLDVTDCDAWDGVLPEGASVAQVKGVAFPSWDGEGSWVREDPFRNCGPEGSFDGTDLQRIDDAQRFLEQLLGRSPSMDWVAALDAVAAEFHNPKKCSGYRGYENEVVVMPMFRLMDLFEGLSVRGDLDLYGRAWLSRLPEGLTVAGDLNLSRCEDLALLPKGLKVGGSLILTGANLGVRTLPPDLEVGGAVVLTSPTGKPIRVPVATYRTMTAWLRVED
jgi:hypothetical protein